MKKSTIGKFPIFFESIFLASSFKMSGSTLAKWSNLITNEERYHNIRFMEERRRYNNAVKTNPARTRLASQVNQQLNKFVFHSLKLFFKPLRSQLISLMLDDSKTDRCASRRVDKKALMCKSGKRCLKSGAQRIESWLN